MIVERSKCFLYVVKEDTCIVALRAGLEPCLIITKSDLASLGIAVHLMKLREVLPFWQSWQSPRLFAPNMIQWLGSNSESSSKELWIPALKLNIRKYHSDLIRVFS